MFNKNYLRKTTKISAKCKRINEEGKRNNKDEDSIKYTLSTIERDVISRRMFQDKFYLERSLKSLTIKIFRK